MKNANGKVLVHCHAGISRSATICMAYLMSTKRLRMEEAYEFVKSRRRIVSPNFNFMGQLLSYEVELFSTTNTPSSVTTSKSCSHLNGSYQTAVNGSNIDYVNSSSSQSVNMIDSSTVNCSIVAATSSVISASALTENLNSCYSRHDKYSFESINKLNNSGGSNNSNTNINNSNNHDQNQRNIFDFSRLPLDLALSESLSANQYHSSINSPLKSQNTTPILTPI